MSEASGTLHSDTGLGDVASLTALLAEERTARLEEHAARIEAQADAARGRSQVAHADALIALLQLQIEKLRREIYGARSEKTSRLIDQMELALEDMTADAAEAEVAAKALPGSTPVKAFDRQRPAKKPFPEHLPRERVVVKAPTTCACCGSARLRKLGEDVTETLEVIPRSWKVIQTVREKFSCRECEKISQPPAPFHVTPRGFAGPGLLAMILFEKFGQHQPLNRQSERYLREGIDLSLSTLADQVGACTVALKPLHDLIEAHVMQAERLHGDDTTVPILAKGKTDTGRVWVYARDDRPYAGTGAPAALFYASRDRKAEHPQKHLAGFAGILQADAYAGYNELYLPDRKPGPVRQALCLAHARRKFFELADIASLRRAKNATPVSPLAFEAVKRMDALFEIECEINGLPTAQRLAVRTEKTVPLMADLENWMRLERVKLSRHAPLSKAFDYMLTRWNGFAAFLHDGRICATNNAAERALRGLALGRKSWLFAGSERGAERAAFMYTLIVTAKMNDIDPQAWLADTLSRIASTSQTALGDLLPWNWKISAMQVKAA